MAGSSFFKRVRNVSGMLAIIIPLLALSGCGEGDGPTRILGTAATPLPPGFEDIPPTLGVFSETHTDPVVSIQDIQQAGNEVVITTETVRVFEGDVSLGLTFTTGAEFFGGATILFDDADLSSYNTLKFSIDTSSFGNFANLTVQLEPPAGGTPGAAVALSDYIPVATAGGWETYEIPLPDFPAVNLALVNKLGFFNARDGGDTLLAGTLYLDDIHFTVTDLGGSGAAGTPIDPEVVLYATDGDPDLVIPDDYDDVTDLGSGSVIDLLYADDDTYTKVLSVFSGTNNGANVAKVGFIGFDPGFVTFYEDLIFKVKGMPNFVVFVTLHEGGNRVRINLTSSDFAEELENGWYQVSIPISSFTGRTAATGIVFESDDSAPMQFRMLLTDIGFSGTGDGGNGGNGGDGGGDIVLVTFDEAEPPTPGVFGNAAASIEAGPAGGDGDALKITRSVTAFSGAFITIPAIPSDVGSQTVSAYVYSPTAGIRFVAKAEYASEQGTGEVDANEAVIEGWQTLTWTFTNLDPAQVYDVFVMLPNLGVVDTESYYVDNITLVGSGGGGNGGGTVEGNLVPDGGFEAAGSAGSFQEPWFVFENGGTVTVSSANSNGGTYAARLQADATSGSPSFPQLKVERLGAGSLAGGESVTISFDVIDVDATGVGKTFVAELFTERADPPGGATNEVIVGGYDLTGSWATRSITTNLGADAAGGVSLLFKADCGANTACTMDVFIDNVAIVIN